ncbi:FAD-dependent oxidoreductase [Lederbergia citrea]|uniref:FAD-dependent oxidoreductase n=1 Tax=Lederbergia citrea TaxID=2833581 RepID=A0A942UIC6_9BACI|nr:FAD-dependent oxidoreductase [Lederbergia citrea]MBS4176746.1 FAD-dependent oxidoreductase [Lederbergia citrea]MBS4203307.1 FAD-dependent oxidoreductase [Lederbergia citrea]MBS4222021.1 FAD-dependent oxidoreductase [Lederbergia citrea]
MNTKNTGEEILPHAPASFWIESTKLETFPTLDKDIDVEVAIIGGGITGISTAFNLVKEGFKVAVFEASSVLNGTTGHTTAKITAQHGLIYDELISHFGEESAKQYFEANENARRFIEECINLHGIECGYGKEDAYVYASSKDHVKDLKKEADAYERLGIDGGFTEEIPLSINAVGAVVMKNQAQFHPLQYLSKLIDFIKENGGVIYEQSVATQMENGNPAVVHFRNGVKVKAKYVVSASHFPFHDGRGYFARLFPKRSYVLAVKTDKPFPGGMYINAEKPTRSIRSVTINGNEALLISGDGHKTGQGEPEIKHYEALEKFAVENFGAKEIIYRWSAQDLVTPDKVPYIGRISEGNDNVFVATGYKKWGMSTSILASLLITDLIIGKDNRYTDLFSPSRFVTDPSIKKVVKENINVAANLISGKFDRPDKELKDIKEGEGAVVTIKGGRAGAFKTEAGQLFVVDTTCTHMGCEINWNSGDRTWDCPCHGSRFSYEGEVIEGPAQRPLKRIDPDSIDYTTS